LHKSDAIQQYHIYLRWQIRAKYWIVFHSLIAHPFLIQ
jgi:hypothetical protein